MIQRATKRKARHGLTAETLKFPGKRRGRPPRVSADTIVQAALAILETRPTEDFTMTGIAQAVGTTTMALYRYFPSRDALLDAVSIHVFGQFNMQRSADAGWQESLFAWACALKATFERYPSLTRLMAWNGHLSGAWLRVQIPVIEALRDAGFRGHRLAYAATWFLTDTPGMLTIALGLGDPLLSATGNEKPLSSFTRLNIPDSMDYLDDNERQLMNEILPHAPNLDTNALIESGFHHLIRGIEDLLRDDPGQP
jgi:AcrR family transcriptional regulator